MTDFLLNIVRWINHTPIVGSILGILFCIGCLIFAYYGIMALLGMICDEYLWNKNHMKKERQ